jgi:hypothetical protein
MKRIGFGHSLPAIADVVVDPPEKSVTLARPAETNWTTTKRATRATPLFDLIDRCSRCYPLAKPRRTNLGRPAIAESWSGSGTAYVAD